MTTSSTPPPPPGVRVLAHFADDPTRAYQLLSWLPVLEQLDEHRAVVVVTRNDATADLVRRHTTLPVALVPSLTELVTLYAELDAGVVLYCNNSMLNFQSLLDARMLHVHLGHGESDKHSMASNNAKAYDRVFVAGEAAVQRHVSTLLDFDYAKLVRIGRPQLDLHREPLIEKNSRRTILYAPTWEGDADYNDYTSLDRYGEQIVRAVLALPDARLVYKPHPKILDSSRPSMQESHRRVRELLEAAAREDLDAGHAFIAEGDILAVMPRCDAIITDVSSVGLDWLYLCTDRPILLTDRHSDHERILVEVPVSRCADLIDADNIDTVSELLATRLERDELHDARQTMRRHYFDDLAVGDSTDHFVRAVTELVALRDLLVDGPGPV